MKYFILIVVSMLSTQVFAGSPIGGNMSGCYNGYFEQNKTCVEVGSEGYALNGGVKVFAKARAMYPNRDGNLVKVSVDLWLNDFNNVFAADGNVPVLVRAIVRGYHRYDTFRTLSLPVTLNRIYGERTLTGSIQFDLNNDFGAEYVETLDRLEVSVPGLAETLIVRF